MPQAAQSVLDPITRLKKQFLDSIPAEAAAKGPVPRIYLACGTEDSLYPESVRMRNHLRSLGMNITYEEWSGIHSWVFWDKAIQRGLEAVVAKER